MIPAPINASPLGPHDKSAAFASSDVRTLSSEQQAGGNWDRTPKSLWQKVHIARAVQHLRSRIRADGDKRKAMKHVDDNRRGRAWRSYVWPQDRTCSFRDVPPGSRVTTTHPCQTCSAKIVKNENFEHRGQPHGARGKLRRVSLALAQYSSRASHPIISLIRRCIERSYFFWTVSVTLNSVHTCQFSCTFFVRHQSPRDSILTVSARQWSHRMTERRENISKKKTPHRTANSGFF